MRSQKSVSTNDRDETSDDLTMVSSVKDISINRSIEPRVEVLELSKSSFTQPKSVLVVKENNLQQARPIELKRKINSVVVEKKLPINRIKSTSSLFETDKSSSKESSQLSSLSLQEAFGKYKRDMIERSKKRQLMIEERARVRKEQSENEKKYALEMNLREKHERILRLMDSRKSNVKIGQKRRFSVHEIKEITRKNYEKLPEVKHKQKLENLEKTKRLNRIRSNVYQKV